MPRRTADLEAAGARFKAAQTERDEAREALIPLVIDAIRDEVPQARIVELTGLTRETVRTIARKAGIGPARDTRDDRRVAPERRSPTAPAVCGRSDDDEYQREPFDGGA